MSKTAKTSHTTRADTVQAKTWQPPARLDVPPAPEGVKYRWVRHTLQGDSQDANVYERNRQHYEVVMASELDGFKAEQLEGGKYDGVVRSGDLILMKIDASIAAQRTEYYENMSARQQKAVDLEAQSQGHENMQVTVDNKTRVTGSPLKFED